MNKLWKNVKESDVKKAIKKFDTQKEKYPEPKNTFLIYNEKRYPAKHIRGIAYKIANKKEILKSEYSGGKETADFFIKLGFEIEYNDKNTTSNKKDNSKLEKKTPQKKLNKVSQKNALQLLLQQCFGYIEVEKKFEWLKTPDKNNIPNEYKSIKFSLEKYRNYTEFYKSNYQLSCDIVVENLKLIIEYDENQHFSFARKISLENYPKDINLFYSKESWIESCKIINAKDNDPKDRDEKRAFYDSVRDIEAYKHGYKLLRIKHGDVDWENPDAINILKKIISALKINNHKIARIIVSDKHYPKNRSLLKLNKSIEKFVKSNYLINHFEFIVTPGGFLKFDFPEELQIKLEIPKAEKNNVKKLQSQAEITIIEFFNQLPEGLYDKLTMIANYITIGIDGYNGNDQEIQLVTIYDFKKHKVIRWTGKFYPIEKEKRRLIKINDLDTHFIRLNNQNILILGCHDLNVFSPRGQAVANKDGWRINIAEDFKQKCIDFKPSIVLQHPHHTDSSKIWNLAWKQLEKVLPFVTHYASGISYYNKKTGIPRSSIEKVLDKTKKGDVVDFNYVSK